MRYLAADVGGTFTDLVLVDVDSAAGSAAGIVAREVLATGATVDGQATAYYTPIGRRA